LETFNNISSFTKFSEHQGMMLAIFISLLTALHSLHPLFSFLAEHRPTFSDGIYFLTIRIGLHKKLFVFGSVAKLTD
jgi:hypothetical protein